MTRGDGCCEVPVDEDRGGRGQEEVGTGDVEGMKKPGATNEGRTDVVTEENV